MPKRLFVCLQIYLSIVNTSFSSPGKQGAAAFASHLEYSCILVGSAFQAVASAVLAETVAALAINLLD